MVTLGSDNPFPSLLIVEGTAPTAPAAGRQRLSIDSTTHLLKLTNSSGVSSNVGSGITRTTLGTTTVGGSFAGRRMVVKKITLATDGLLSCIRAHVKGDASNPAGITPVVYVDSSGSPTNVIVSGAISASGNNTRSVKLNTTARWMMLPVGAWLTAADYWIGVLFDEAGTTGMTIAFSSGTGSDRTITGGLVFAADSSVVSISTGTDDYSIHADILR